MDVEIDPRLARHGEQHFAHRLVGDHHRILDLRLTRLGGRGQRDGAHGLGDRCARGLLLGLDVTVGFGHRPRSAAGERQAERERCRGS